jgi:uncharacterized membrane protein
LALLAAWIYFRDIEVSSLWLDEAYSWKQSQGTFLEVIFATASDNYPPLHNLILNIAQRFMGTSEFSLRMPSALCMIAAIVVLYDLVCRIFNRNLATCVAILMVFSQFNLYYAQEARNYALLELLSILYLRAIMLWNTSYKRDHLVELSLFACLLCYTHVYGAFLVASVAAGFSVWKWLRKTTGDRSVLAFVLAHGIAIFLFMPWIFVLYTRVQSVVKDFWIAPPSIDYLDYNFTTIAGSHIGLAALAIGLIFFAFHIKSLPTKKDLGSLSQHDVAVLLTLWLFGPFMIGYILSITIRPILFHRYLITSLPALFLASALGYLYLVRSKSQELLVLISVGCLVHFFQFSSRILRDDIRQTSAVFKKYAKPDDCVYFLDDATPFEFYLRPLPECRKEIKAGKEINPENFSRSGAWLMLTQSGYGIRALSDFKSNIWAIQGRPEFGTMLYIVNRK